jgi:hypothetical protein
MDDITELLVAWRKSVAELDRRGSYGPVSGYPREEGESTPDRESDHLPLPRKREPRQWAEPIGLGWPLAHAPP